MPLRDQVYALVRKAIVTGKLAPGSPVNEIEIALKLGISRTPVREAVKKVSDEGLIEVFAQNGTFVADISRKQVEEAYIIRIALELESIKRAALVIEAHHIQDLEDIINAHETAVKRSRFDEAITRDDDFHRYIAEVNGFTMLWKAVDVSKAQMDRYRLLALPSPGAGEETIVQHRAILDALAKRDQAGAMKALETHLETSLRCTISLLEAGPADSSPLIA
ncbi:GntR family transcriptional regulator [Methylovirgula sp. 4M-Z18]|nr:GntR family transcriptional regulator [Methylovirgula sp. 4M-Z18]